MTATTPAMADRIVHDPEIMCGKPTVRGTRITVEAVLAHLAANPDLDDLFAAYPRLTTEDLKAVLAYARLDAERNERFKVFERIAAAFAHETPEESDRLAALALAEVREDMRRERAARAKA